jgi:hypothetical protein
LVVSQISCSRSNPSGKTFPIAPLLEVNNSNHIHLH